MNDYNFFSGFQRKRRKTLSIHSPFFLGFAIMFICAAASGALYLDNMQLSKQIDSMTEEMQNIKSSNSYITADKLQKSLDAMVKYDTSADAVLKSIQEAQVLNSKLISSLLAAVPINATVVSFGMNNNSFALTCNALDRKTAADLVLSLKETDLCDSVQLNSVTNKEDGSGVVVSINGTLKVGQK